MAFVLVLWMEKPALFIMVLILATEWTKWDELERVTEGTIVFTDVEHDVVIEMVHATGWLVAHNTAYLLDPAPGLTWGMEARFADTSGTFAYNLTNGAIFANRDGASGALSGNRTDALPTWFADAAAGDLHLAPSTTEAIDQAGTLPQITDDYDGDPRPFALAADVGADEYMPGSLLYLPIIVR